MNADTTILVAEDEPHIVHILSVWLERHGYNVLQSRNGADALKYLKETNVDALISDLNMPNIDGLTLVKMVRDELRMNIPIILLTARCDQAKIACDLAPYQVLLCPKPFMPSRLVIEIERLLSATKV